MGKSDKMAKNPMISLPFLLSLALQQGLALDEGLASGVQLAGLAEEVASDAGCGEISW
jgi:hypothetical protein